MPDDIAVSCCNGRYMAWLVHVVVSWYYMLLYKPVVIMVFQPNQTIINNLSDSAGSKTG